MPFIAKSFYDKFVSQWNTSRSLTLSRVRAPSVIREFDPDGELPLRHRRGEIHNRETCESNPRGDRGGRIARRRKMRIRVTLAASNHVALLSIYLSSCSRKRIRLKFIAASAGEIYTDDRERRGKGKGEREKRAYRRGAVSFLTKREFPGRVVALCSV